MKRANLEPGTKFRYIDPDTRAPGPTTFLAKPNKLDEVVSGEPNVLIGSLWSAVIAIVMDAEVEVVP